MLTKLKFTIRSKIAIGYFLIICCLGASIVIVTDRMAALQDEVAAMTSLDIEAHHSIAAVRFDAVSMENGQRGYLLTGEEDYLEAYNTGKTQWEVNYNSLYTYLSDNPNTHRELEEVKFAIQSWVKEVAEPTIEMKRNGDEEALSAFLQANSSKPSINDLPEKFESLRDKEIQSTKLRILELENRNRLLTLSIYILLFVVTIIAFIIVAFVSGLIVRTIKQVSNTITNIASAGGDLTTRIQVKTNDEIRDLGEATNKLLASLESQNWIQSRVAEVATMNQGISDLPTLAQSFLSKVAPMIGASYGVFYIRKESHEGQRLVRIAAYASQGEEGGRSSFKIGEGLVGQSAQDKRFFLLNQMPEHHAVITTGLGQTVPQSILIVPIEYEGKVEAVVEFASIESFTSEHLKLLEEIAQDFGIAVINVAGRMEVERLLSESQMLTEELQAQTEELQTQSEELQMQQEEMRMTTEHLEEQNLYAQQKTKELEKTKRELEDYSARLKQSSEYKTNFLANMSHELRTPLNSILILSQLLSDNDNGTLTEDEQGYAKVIYASGNDLLKLIDDILDLSKIEAGKAVLNIDEVNLTEIPELIRLSFDHVAENKGLPFHIHMESGLPAIWHTDGQRLQQIIKNLLSNAFKFTEQGSVTMRLDWASPIEVDQWLPMYSGERVLAVSVTDTGIGIPLNKQQLIFEAFQQVDGKTNRQYGGTGLGLSISNEFAKLLDGNIALSSTPNEGSCFTLYLPNLLNGRRHSVQQAQLEAAASIEEDSHVLMGWEQADSNSSAAARAINGHEELLFKGKRVLLAEDDARNVYALVKALENKGMDVIVAGNGKRCMELLHADPEIDLILMDIMMPVMDGFETMKAIRELPQLRNMPIIALTAKAMKSDRDKCLEAGASDYISKPLQMDQLFSLMRVWLTKQVGQS